MGGAVDEGHLDRCVLQRLGGEQSAESGADDNDPVTSLCTLVHLCLPIRVWIVQIKYTTTSGPWPCVLRDVSVGAVRE